MPDLLDRLKTALADRYAIQEEIGAGGMATVSRPSVAYTPAPLASTPSWIHLWDSIPRVWSPTQVEECVPSD